MRENFTCPRRKENFMDSEDSPFKLSGKNLDFWNPQDGTCTYCGSMNPDYFMKRLQARDAVLVPTEKNYKAYLLNAGGEKFKMTARYDDLPFEGWDSPNHHWVTKEHSEQKFYYFHLSDEQRQEFVQLLNSNEIQIDYPYILPFFIVRNLDDGSYNLSQPKETP